MVLGHRDAVEFAAESEFGLNASLNFAAAVGQRMPRVRLPVGSGSQTASEE